MNAVREGGKKLLGDKRNNPAARFVRRWEEHWKGMLVPSTLFEEMGFHYTGPIDGHDLPALLKALKTLQGLKGPQLLHVITTKGKGLRARRGRSDRISRSQPLRSGGRRGQEGRRRPSPPTPRYSATGCATWRRPTRH